MSSTEDLEARHRQRAQQHGNFVHSHRPKHRNRSVGKKNRVALAPGIPEIPSEFLRKLQKGADSESSSTGKNVNLLDGKTEINHKETKREKYQKNIFASKGELRKIMFKYVESKTFSMLVLLVIFVNTIILVAQTEEIIQVRVGWYVSASDNCFLGVYVIECVLKIYVWRKQYFREGWNLFDFLIVMFSIVDFLLPMIIANLGFDMSGAAIFRVLKIFRFVKAIRALRVLRTIRVLNHLQVIMTTCFQSIQSMGAIVGLILLFLYMFAVIGRSLYADKDPERFGTLISAAFTLFQLLTLDDWFYIYRDVVDKHPDSWHVFLYLMVYIVMEYFIFLNLFVAVLVDNFQLTLEAANEAKKKAKENKVSKEDEDEDDLYWPSTTASSMSSEDSQEMKATKLSYNHFYNSNTTDSKRTLSDLFTTLAALEYNLQLNNGQQANIDAIIDLCLEASKIY